MNSTLLFTCPQCHSPSRAKNEWVGKRVKCLRCGYESQVPTPEQSLSPPANHAAHTTQTDTVHDLPSISATYQRWEYRIVRHASSAVLELVDDLNALGEEGWECVGIMKQPQVLLYKRPKR
jgi:hypothetical protein